jgi:leucyl-tRNA synthetase
VILLLAPLVPHITQELWEMMGYRQDLGSAGWPVYDPTVASEEQVTIVIQINGKVRSRIIVPADEEIEQIKARARADDKISALIAGKDVLKEIYVPKKLLNIVVKG